MYHKHSGISHWQWTLLSGKAREPAILRSIPSMRRSTQCVGPGVGNKCSNTKQIHSRGTPETHRAWKVTPWHSPWPASVRPWIPPSLGHQGRVGEMFVQGFKHHTFATPWAFQDPRRLTSKESHTGERAAPAFLTLSSRTSQVLELWRFPF